MSRSSVRHCSLDLHALLRPLAPEHLGWLSLAYNLHDEPNRCAAFQCYVFQAFQEHVSTAVYNDAMTALLQRAPWLSVVDNIPKHMAAAQVLPEGPLCVAGSESVPREANECTACGGALYRWHRHVEAKFLTLSRGMVTGKVWCFRCSNPLCKSVHAGIWRWDDVPDDSNFPNGFHHPCVAVQPDPGGPADGFLRSPNL